MMNEDFTMTKKDVGANITKITPNLPDYMAADQGVGLDALKTYIVPPRIKVIQKQAASNLLDKFGAGDVILSPVGSVIVEMPRDGKGKVLEGAKTEFFIVPLFFYAEWVTWNPLELKGSEPAVYYRTTNPDDPIVLKARNPSLRLEPYPNDKTGKLFRRHVEHLNYVVTLHEHALSNTPCIMSFQRGEHGAGANFASLLKMRAAAIFGGRYLCTINHRVGKLGDWFGIDVSNPNERPWVNADEYAAYRELHEEFVKLHQEARLRASLDDSDATIEDGGIPAAANSTEF